MLKRDWSSIAKLIDVHTRVAISLATDSEILKCFELGFPHLFTEGDDEGPFKIPLSILKQAATEVAVEELGDEEFEGNFWLHLAMAKYPHLTIPISHEWDLDHEVPKQVLNQFVGQTALAGIVITYLDRQHIVLSMNLCSGQEFVVGSVITKPLKIDDMQLVLLDYVEVDK